MVICIMVCQYSIVEKSPQEELQMGGYALDLSKVFEWACLRT